MFIKVSLIFGKFNFFNNYYTIIQGH